MPDKVNTFNSEGFNTIMMTDLSILSSNNDYDIDAPSIAPSKYSRKPVCKYDLNFKRKLLYTLYAVILFIIVSLPETYDKTNDLFLNNKFLKDTFHLNVLGDKGPTINGVLLHSIVFGIATYILMILLH
jgi:hypothetical protein